MKSSNLVIFWNKPNQSIEYFCYQSSDFSAYKFKNRRKSQSDNSRMKKDMQSCFSGLTRKSNLSYLLWKHQHLKSTFSSRVYFVKLSTNRKKLSIAKAQSRQRREMHKIAFMNHFHFSVEKSSTWPEKLIIRLGFYHL